MRTTPRSHSGGIALSLTWRPRDVKPLQCVTGQLVDTLAFYWLTAKWEFAGGHSYGGPERTGPAFRYDHGLAFRMLFLPDGTLLDTTRREMESEGIVDCLLIKGVQKQIAAMNGAAAARARQ